MKSVSSFRLRKCSDINLDLPFFEVIDEANEIVMDVSESDDGERSILFNPACVGKTISIELILRIIRESSDLLNNEKN